jgi:hypothetical protein
MAVSPQDVMVVIQFNQLEDWSFSAGKMAMNNAGGAAEAPRFSTISLLPGEMMHQ